MEEFSKNKTGARKKLKLTRGFPATQNKISGRYFNLAERRNHQFAPLLNYK